jgi:tRNA A-37 threonylcarbamoyl transferase component Bud32
MGRDLELLFREVADLTPEQRQAYFAAHEIPAELRREVESLLEFDTVAPATLAARVSAAAESFLTSEPAPDAGGRCGPYTLVRLLGRGGMGTVFLARRTDGEVDQQVAIKFVRGAAEADGLRERFLRERQILASLNHSGIARLLDAGRTGTGQPYLVMEYIAGQPIDQYCNALDLRQRLTIFLKVCDALSYAHRSLVIHRDLKPSNILVDTAGEPKLLDFGIAKMLDEPAENGITQMRVLTPDYASPEQVLGVAHTTATDVYSLGAVLRKLLSATRELPRDLQAIIEKAQRAEAEERYRSVDDLAADITAFLESRPVGARAGNAWYRTRRFVRRRWLPVTAMAAVIASLSVGLYVANRERAVAQHRFQQLRQLANRVISLDDQIRNLPGSTKARQQVVAASMEYLDGLSRETRNDNVLATEVAYGYVHLAEVQGVPAFFSLGQASAADETLRKADGLVKTVISTGQASAEALLVSALVLGERMMIADSVHRDNDALVFAEETASRTDAFVRHGKADRNLERQAAGLYMNVGQALMNRHMMDQAILSARKGTELARSCGAPAYQIAQGLSLQAYMLRLSGDLDGALPLITQARHTAETATYTSEGARLFVLYSILMRQGQILGADDGISLERFDDALEPFQTGYDMVDRAAAADPNDVTMRARLATVSNQLAGVLGRRDPARALAVYDHAIERQREVKNDVRARREEARLLARSSYALRALHREREARGRIDAAMELLHAAGLYPAATLELGSEAQAALSALADDEAAVGHTARAIEIDRDVLSKIMTGRLNPATDLRHADGMSGIYRSLAGLCRSAHQVADAESYDVLRLEIWRAWDQKLPNNSYIQRRLREP